MTGCTKISFIFFMVMICGCGQNPEHDQAGLLFSLMDNQAIGINFLNEVEYTEEYNTYTYRNFYNGGGVGIGDINNDGLADIYFTGNIADNKLYLNLGNMKFKDISESAGVACPDVWSTGISMVDINGDGWLDMYVCKSGDPSAENRHNELFINNGDLTFTEKAEEYGIADLGLSTHAAFFDYDRDGDLDCYLLNNSFQSVKGYDLTVNQREIRDPLGGNKLYRNDDGHFTDVSQEANIYGSTIGFGLGVSIGDIDRDGWPDIYVSNDFFERDYLYLNNRDGTFREVLEQQIMEISLGSMGADLADINNDGFPEIFVTEMIPELEDRFKTKSMFETWEKYQLNFQRGYHRQFARNVLQLNNRNGTFSEIGRLAGVEASDWSWGALILDMDNDGFKDIFIANGIYKDLLDQDYLNFYSDPSIVREMIRSEEQAILKMIDAIPSERISNYAFQNQGNLQFINKAKEWGLDLPSFSNGAAYGDLDNDGDLDLVVNNVNMPPFIYKNLSGEKTGNHYLTVKLTGAGKNPQAIGARVFLYRGDQMRYREQMTMRGFQSTVDDKLVFGLGEIGHIDSLVVEWPDGRKSVQKDLKTDQLIILNEDQASFPLPTDQSDTASGWFQSIDVAGMIDYVHKENDYVDFDRDRLLFHMISNEGPKMCVGDVNSDGLEDIFIGGARDMPGKMYVQQKNRNFMSVNEKLFRQDKTSEDTDCLFFDADGDGDVDLYVASGGNEFSSSSTALIDRLYLNDGSGNFKKSVQLLPTSRFENSSSVAASDFDQDGDLDLLVGTRTIPLLYGVPANVYLLQNNGTGIFTDVTPELAPGLMNLGLATDIAWTDLNGDGFDDVLIAGEYMPIRLFLYENGKYIESTEAGGLANTQGWWNVLKCFDIDRDGDIDFIGGNHGLNSRFFASREKPITLYVNDFDKNGSVEHILTMHNGDVAYPFIMKPDLVSQIPSLGKIYKRHADFKGQTIEQIFSPAQLENALQLNVVFLSTSLFINQGDGTFEIKSLPLESQFSPVYAVEVQDFNADGNPDILLGGNLYRSKPEVGIYAASYGTLLLGDGDGNFSNVPVKKSGLQLNGEIRDLHTIRIDNAKYLWAVRNDMNLQVYKINGHEN
ncbi:MAG: VCBS repeat-containing protein [Cyclobacteriaceae bacterium]|nr:VCBS repeat-containing protein [Cyclobacteriaceae bacterium]